MAMPDPAEVPRPWLAAYPPGVPSAYRWPRVDLARFLDDAARDFPATAAVTWLGASWNWAEVDALADRVAGALQRAGVAPSDRVGLALDTGPAALVVAFATWRTGATLVLLDGDDDGATLWATGPRVTFADEVAGRDGVAGTVVVSGPGDWQARGRAARAWGLLGRTPHRGGGPPPGPRQDEVMSWAAFVADAPRPRRITCPPETPAVLVASTGADRPRRVVTLTHGNLVANAFQARLWLPDVQAGRERLLAAAPFTRPFGLVAGLLMGALSAATLVLPDGNADGLVDAIGRDRPSLFMATPSMVRAVVDAGSRRGADLQSLRLCLVAGGTLGADVASRYRVLSGDGRLRQAFGVPEAAALTHANAVYGRAHAVRGGLPLTGTASVVVDPDDPERALPADHAGLLLVAGPQVMAGYWGQPDATARMLRGGWLDTGHQARMDDLGHVTVLDDPAAAGLPGLALMPDREAAG